MALGILSIIYVVLGVLAGISQALLYKGKNQGKNIIYIINMLLGLILAYMAFTSFPVNFTGQRILAAILALVSVLALVAKASSEKFIFTSKIMLSIGIFGSALLLFL